MQFALYRHILELLVHESPFDPVQTKQGLHRLWNVWKMYDIVEHVFNGLENYDIWVRVLKSFGERSFRLSHFSLCMFFGLCFACGSCPARSVFYYCIYICVVVWNSFRLFGLWGPLQPVHILWLVFGHGKVILVRTGKSFKFCGDFPVRTLTIKSKETRVDALTPSTNIAYRSCEKHCIT